jgi:RecB family exonuclease/energy-coupling factor transporter ATP-binding protein EcfA2
VIKAEKLSSSNFPVEHYSASSMRLFSTNPILFKIQYINRDRFDTTAGISGVIGNAFHQAMMVYYGGSDVLIAQNEEESIKNGLTAGMDFLSRYNDGFIKYTTTIPNKQKAFDVFSFAFNSYVKEKPYGVDQVIAIEEKMEERVDVEWRGQRLTLPVKLKGYIDKVIRDKEGRLKIVDYKTCYSFSNPEKIDGAKILQAVEYYLLTYAKYGEEPYSVTFEEVKYTKNSDGGKQVREYEVVFSENDLYFDFYFRFYEDMTRALSGEMVYVPNVNAMFDNEVAIVSYIHRLDVEEEQAKLMKKHNVKTVTDLLKKQMQSAGSMKKLLKMVEENFVTAKNLNYSSMKTEEKIKTKLMEHGMMLEFDSMVEGNTVDLYRYIPTIGLKMSRLKNYIEDIEQVLGKSGVRILAPIQNSTLIGFEVPRDMRTFPEIPKIQGFDIAIGKNSMGEDVRFDLRDAPHLLVAGSSGSGKSVFLSSIIKQLDSLSEVDIHLFDPKIVELAVHKKDKNVVQYETNILSIYEALRSLVLEMNVRYEMLAKSGVRSIAEYKGKMRYKFVFIDEFGDLIMQDYVHENTVYTGDVYTKGQHAGEEKVRVESVEVSKEISKMVLLLAQKARACGIHVVISTQRPSVDVITGTIKANFPTKVALRTAKAIDSVVIMDDKGAEKLLGKGDMLFISDRGVERLQGYKS